MLITKVRCAHEKRHCRWREVLYDVLSLVHALMNSGWGQLPMHTLNGLERNVLDSPMRRQRVLANNVNVTMDGANKCLKLTLRLIHCIRRLSELASRKDHIGGHIHCYIDAREPMISTWDLKYDFVCNPHLAQSCHSLVNRICHEGEGASPHLGRLADAASSLDVCYHVSFGDVTFGHAASLQLDEQ